MLYKFLYVRYQTKSTECIIFGGVPKLTAIPGIIPYGKRKPVYFQLVTFFFLEMEVAFRHKNCLIID
jgi:hypothetical protein